VKKTKYSEEQIREILSTAYPGKSAAELDAMVQETMDQYLAESKSSRKSQSSKPKKGQ
jgi:hypothetical protein